MDIVSKILANVVVEDGCWIWQGAVNTGGYGHIHIKKRVLRVHRLMYEAYKGPLRAGMCALHRCDRRRCANPDHLFPGTRSDNMKDMIAKGRDRHLSGTDVKVSKLNWDDVRVIRELAGTMSHHQIAKRFNMHHTTIGDVINNKTWRKKWIPT